MSSFISNAAHNIDTDIYTANNFFAHCVRETDITKYGTNKPLILMTTPKEIYRYSNSTLKHLTKNSLKRIEKYLLYSKKPVITLGNEDGRSHNNENEKI